MIRNNKIKFIISSIIIVLPILFGVIYWNKLPSEMPTHWGMSGEADRFSSKPFAVFFMPLILLAIHVLCLILSGFDRSNRGQNKKALSLVFFMCPAVSLVTNALTYSAALNYDFEPSAFLSIFLGVMFIVIGNYMPKCKQNRTLGIKLPTTLKSEANWNATHRFAGKLWFFGGFPIILFTFLPEKLLFVFLFAGVFIMVAAPIVYSIIFYIKERS